MQTLLYLKFILHIYVTTVVAHLILSHYNGKIILK